MLPGCDPVQDRVAHGGQGGIVERSWGGETDEELLFALVEALGNHVGQTGVPRGRLWAVGDGPASDDMPEPDVLGRAAGGEGAAFGREDRDPITVCSLREHSRTVGLLARFTRPSPSLRARPASAHPADVGRVAGDEAVGLVQVFREVGVGKPRRRVVLDPQEPARRQIRRRAQPRLLLEDLEGEFAHLEGVGGLPVPPSADGEDLAAHLPNMGVAPLNHMGGRRKRPAERIEFVIGQGAASRHTGSNNRTFRPHAQDGPSPRRRGAAPYSAQIRRTAAQTAASTGRLAAGAAPMAAARSADGGWVEKKASRRS